MKKTVITLVAGLMLAVGASQLKSQVVFNGSYSQNFNGLGTGTVTWTDNSTLTGWSVTAENSQTSFAASTGSDTAGAVYNFGANSGADRSLGFIGSGSNDWTNLYLQLQNNTGSTLSQLTVSYDGELWRSGGAQSTNSNNIFSFYYATGSPTLFDSTSVTGWTAAAALNYAPTVSVAAGFLTGSGTTISSTITGLSLANGSSIYLRWFGDNGAGTDAGLAIDNLSITTIPEPSTYALIGLGLGALWFLRRRKATAANS